jgi:hypothetical protein
MDGTVVGSSTVSVADVGGASLRIKIPEETRDGGYLLMIRAPGSRAWLPAIAGVPGRRYDDLGPSRAGLAELMVLARPVVPKDEGGGEVERVTFLPGNVLKTLYPTSSSVEVMILHRATDFSLGLNAGRWLTIRMSEITKESCRWLEEQGGRDASAGVEELLASSGLELEDATEPPPPDAMYLFEHLGMSNNSALPRGNR